jgi:membrane fusion protein (multidrug efflux system)
MPQHPWSIDMARRLRTWVSLTVILAAAGIWGYASWRRHQVFVDTDDAYVRGHVVTVATRVPGAILTLEVKENEPVKAGQMIALLDPKDYDAMADRARGSLAEARASMALNQAQIAQAQAGVRAAASQESLAELERNRLETLVDRQSIPRQKLDQARTAFEVATAQLDAARKQVSALQGALQVSTSKEAQALAGLEQARLQRSYCVVPAPCDGFVARKMAEPGMVVAAGQPLLAIVPLGQAELWVEANFKETQLRNVRPGQRVALKADLDDRSIPGVVESIAAGTGAAFSLLPAENATGNWVKVVQRIPVRIRLAEGADPGHKLRLGLSVSAVIDTRSGPALP